MKKHNAVKVVLVTMLVFMLLTWILPAAYFQTEYVDQGRIQMGLFDLFNYPLTSLSYFGYIGLFIILVGGFYGILYKIPAYRTFLDKIVAKCAGKEKIIISLIMIIIAVLVSVCGLQIGIMLFFPFIVSLILLMGYDKIVAALTLVGSTTVGLAGTTYAYSNVSVLLNVLSLKLDYEIGVRAIILVVGLILLIFNTIMYIKRMGSDVKVKNAEKTTIKKTIEEAEEVEETATDEEEVEVKTTKSTKSTTKSTKAKGSTKSTGKNSKTTNKSKKSSKSSKNVNKAAAKDEDIIVVKESVSTINEGYVPTIVDSTHKIWPIVISFVLMFVIFVLAFIPWGDTGFGISVFEDATKAVTEYELFGFPLFAKILGTFSSFGTWTITDMFLVMFTFVLLLGLIYKVKFDDLFEGFVNGAKKALAPAVVALLIYTILVLVTYHPFQLVIYKAILGITKGFNVATTTLVAILASFFNADPAYVFQSVLPYLTSVITNADNYSIIGIIFQACYGLVMLVAPTSLVLMSVLAYLNVSYKEWLGKIWKLLVELFVVLLIIFIILALI